MTAVALTLSTALAVANPTVTTLQEVKLEIPSHPLAVGALTLSQVNPHNSYTSWTQGEKEGTFFLAQRVAAIWREQNIANFLVIGKSTLNSPFEWEMVPYETVGNRLSKQVKVLWNLIFRSSHLSEAERDLQARALRDPVGQIYMPDISLNEPPKGIDAFCDAAVLEKQTVWEGKHVRLLYNYAPLDANNNKLHFLIVPKSHRTDFTELFLEEYLEAEEIAQALIAYYQETYPIAYLFDKTGEEAGQSVKHWHRHVVFAGSTADEFWGKLKVLRNMIFGSFPLSKEELASRVASLKSELTAHLSKLGHQTF